MNLYLSIIADALKKKSFDISAVLYADTPITNIRLFNPGQTFSNSFLYFATADQLKKTPEKSCPKNLLVLGPPFPEGFFHLPHNILYLDSTKDEIELFTCLQDIFADFEAWQQEIQEAMISQMEISQLLEIISKKLDNPIALFDSSNSLVHWAGDFKYEYKGSIWEKAFQNGYTMDYFSYPEWQELTQKMSQTNAPFISKSKDNNHESILSCPLKSNGTFIGSLGMTSVNTTITDGQIKLVSIIKGLLEKAIIHSGSLLHGSDPVPFYVESLLTGMSVDEKTIAFYLKRKKWNCDDSFCLLNFSYPVDIVPTDYSIHPYIGRIKHFFSGGIYCPFENSFIVILNMSDSAKQDNLKTILQQLFDKFMIRCGISSEFYYFPDLRYYYIQAKSALAEGIAQHPQQAYYYFQDYYQSNLFHQLNNSTCVQSLCHPRILKIHKDNDPNQVHLLKTLSAFLINGRNLTLTANALKIHRNTLLYRLDKLSELLEINLREVDQTMLFYLLMSCVLVEYF
ncbi:helix-turn-helix domain-containing protein [Eubacteriaceae bacterium ES2]|nr:helix-turn-helix domain-containing protein [Eubacteriaceae bacterium ES2]